MSLASYQTAPPRDKCDFYSYLALREKSRKGQSVARELKTPLLTVDIIVEVNGLGVILIERKNPPHGWSKRGQGPFS